LANFKFPQFLLEGLDIIDIGCEKFEEYLFCGVIQPLEKSLWVWTVNEGLEQSNVGFDLVKHKICNNKKELVELY
jgi:hypothetical protein